MLAPASVRFSILVPSRLGEHAGQHDQRTQVSQDEPPFNRPAPSHLAKCWKGYKIASTAPRGNNLMYRVRK